MTKKYILPRDYLELGKQGKIEEAIAAIWRHVGYAKVYKEKKNDTTISKFYV